MGPGKKAQIIPSEMLAHCARRLNATRAAWGTPLCSQRHGHRNQHGAREGAWSSGPRPHAPADTTGSIQRAQNPARGEKKRAKHSKAGTTGEPGMGRGAARTHRHGAGGQNSLPDLPRGDLGCLQLSRVWDYGSKHLNSPKNRGPQSPAHTATRPQHGALPQEQGTPHFGKLKLA